MRLFLAEFSPADKLFDDKKRLSLEIASLLDQAGLDRRAKRCKHCGQFLGFQELAQPKEGRTHKLVHANFCKDRFCPMCQWRKSLVWKSRYWSQLPKLLENYQGARFIFLTLTVKNCSVESLRDTIGQMNKAYARMTKLKAWPALGYHKALEVTYNAETGEAHPHFHILMMVKASYFSSPKYLKQAKWTEIWQKCLRIEYTPIVHVTAVRPFKLQGESIADEVQKCVKETIKYCIKSDQVKAMNPERFKIFTDQMHGLRTQVVGGIFKEYFRANEPEDLLHVDEDKMLADAVIDAPVIWFTWNAHIGRYGILQYDRVEGLN